MLSQDSVWEGGWITQGGELLKVNLKVTPGGLSDIRAGIRQSKNQTNTNNKDQLREKATVCGWPSLKTCGTTKTESPLRWQTGRALCLIFLIFEQRYGWTSQLSLDKKKTFPLWHTEYFRRQVMSKHHIQWESGCTRSVRLSGLDRLVIEKETPHSRLFTTIVSQMQTRNQKHVRIKTKPTDVSYKNNHSSRLGSSCYQTEYVYVYCHLQR